MESKLVNELEEPKLIISEASNKPEETEEKKKIGIIIVKQHSYFCRIKTKK
jgi:hypothetical protein